MVEEKTRRRLNSAAGAKLSLVTCWGENHTENDGKLSSISNKIIN